MEPSGDRGGRAVGRPTAFKYFVPGSDPDSRLGHPLQPAFLKALILIAPAALCDQVAVSPPRAGTDPKRGAPGRRTGILMFWLILPMALWRVPDRVSSGRPGLADRVVALDPRSRVLAATSSTPSAKRQTARAVRGPGALRAPAPARDVEALADLAQPRDVGLAGQVGEDEAFVLVSKIKTASPIHLAGHRA